jgi:hypothetical protein
MIAVPRSGVRNSREERTWGSLCPAVLDVLSLYGTVYL